MPLFEESGDGAHLSGISNSTHIYCSNVVSSSIDRVDCNSIEIPKKKGVKVSIRKCIYKTTNE